MSASFRRTLHIFTYRDQFFSIDEEGSGGCYVRDDLGKRRRIDGPHDLRGVREACRSILAEHGRWAEELGRGEQPA